MTTITIWFFINTKNHKIFKWTLLSASLLILEKHHPILLLNILAVSIWKHGSMLLTVNLLSSMQGQMQWKKNKHSFLRLQSVLTTNWVALLFPCFLIFIYISHSLASHLSNHQHVSVTCRRKKNLLSHYEKDVVSQNREYSPKVHMNH